MQSLDPEYEGFNLDDFMRAMGSLAAWHKDGRPAGSAASKSWANMSNEERVRVMIDSGFSSAKANLDKLRNDVEQQRLELLTEREKLELRHSELDSKHSELDSKNSEVASKSSELEQRQTQLELLRS